MMHRIRVLVVDDSAFARGVIARKLNADPEIEVMGSARDGVEAVEKTKSLKPDVVTMDVQMPRMDGLATVRQVMAECPTPIVMVSSLTSAGAQATIQALELGAVDFFLKPSLSTPAGNDETSEELTTKVKQAARVTQARLKAGAPSTVLSSVARRQTSSNPTYMDKVIVIGSSTGGPRALCQLFRLLPSDIPATALVVQHMPPGFTRSLAERLNQVSDWHVKEAEPGDTLQQGHALVAPGGYHMKIRQGNMVELTSEPPVNGLRPAADVTMESAAWLYRASAVGVVLTGIGSDGTLGSAMVRAAGGYVLAEDESTCTVFGMPKAVIESGNANAVVPLPQMADEIARICRANQKLQRGVRV